MPSRAPRACGHCGGVHSTGERCPRVAQRDSERKARHDQKRLTAGARGYDAEWRKLRTRILASSPTCARCGAPASVVDHVVPIRTAPARRLDPSNLQALCVPCHSSAKQSEERRHRKD